MEKLKSNEVLLSKSEIDTQIEQMTDEYNHLVNQIELLRNELANLTNGYSLAEDELEKFKESRESIVQRIKEPSFTDRLLQKIELKVGKDEIGTREGFLKWHPFSKESKHYISTKQTFRDSLLELRDTKTRLSQMMNENLSFRGRLIGDEKESPRTNSINKIKARISSLEQEMVWCNEAISRKRTESVAAFKREQPDEWKRLEKNRSRELGIVYDEELQELDQSEQERLGIKRIRIKTVVEGPTDLYQEPSKYSQIYSFLTEGIYPSYSTWNHVLGGDGGWLSDKSDRFTKEGKYEQEMLPVECILSGGGMSTEARFFEIRDSNLEYVTRPETEDGVVNTPMVYPMCMGTGKPLWRDNRDAPFFLFSNRNKFFVNYINSIQNDPEIREMLILSNWHVNSDVILEKNNVNKPAIIKLRNPQPRVDFIQKYTERRIAFLTREIKVDPNNIEKLRELSELANNTDNFSLALQAYEERFNIDNDMWPRRYAALMAYLIGDHDKAKKYLMEHFSLENSSDTPSDFEKGWEEVISEYLRRRNSALTRRNPDFTQRHDMAPLKYMMEGIEVDETTPIKFPIVRHPKIKPLRWCHSSVGVMRDEQNRLKIMFFES